MRGRMLFASEKTSSLQRLGLACSQRVAVKIADHATHNGGLWQQELVDLLLRRRLVALGRLVLLARHERDVGQAKRDEVVGLFELAGNSDRPVEVVPKDLGR